MKIESSEKIERWIRPEIIPISNCRHRCANCPMSIPSDGPSVRFIGYSAEVIGAASKMRNRAIEVAGGNLPTTIDELRKLKKAGVAKILVPVFIHQERPVSNLFDEDLIHLLESAKKAGIGASMVAPVIELEGASSSSFEPLRRLMRLGWVYHARLIMVGDSTLPPCIAARSE